MTSQIKIGGSRGKDWFAKHNRPEFMESAIKNNGGSWFAVANNTRSGLGHNPDGRKFPGLSNGSDFSKRPYSHWGNKDSLDGLKNARNWRSDGKGSLSATTSSHSDARKQASALIAKIPYPLARHIAAVYKGF